MNNYEEKVKKVCRMLGVPQNYEELYSLPLQVEETNLVSIGYGIYNREQFLSKEASGAWAEMKNRAEAESVHLCAISAFRSVNYQASLIERKLSRGNAIMEILKQSAAPGYSEHHAGRALDLTADGCEPLCESFESTTAFRWLIENASMYSFSLSYPKNNNSGVVYEPWHWAYSA